MTDPALPVPAAEPAKAPAHTPPAQQFTFYFSASHKASFHPGRSLCFFKGQEFTEACMVGHPPAPRADLKTIGTGSQADVTNKP